MDCSRGLLRRRPGLQELRQPGARGLQPRGHAVVVGGLDLVVDDQALQLGPLLVPAAAQLVEAGVAGHPRRVPGREALRVGPRRARLHGDDLLGGAGEQLAVVADVQHALRRLPQPRPPASACRARRGSCRARRAAAPRPGPRSSSSSANRFCSPPDSVVMRRCRAVVPRQPEHRDRRRVERHLRRVAARLAPRHERVGVADLAALGVVERRLGGPQPHRPPGPAAGRARARGRRGCGRRRSVPRRTGSSRPARPPGRSTRRRARSRPRPCAATWSCPPRSARRARRGRLRRRGSSRRRTARGRRAARARPPSPRCGPRGEDAGGAGRRCRGNWENRRRGRRTRGRRQARRADQPRRGRPAAADPAHPQDRPRGHARPDGDGRARLRGRARHEAAGPPRPRHEGLHRDDPARAPPPRPTTPRARSSAPPTRRRVTDAAIAAGVAALTGAIQQVPSSVSAIKVDGRRAYALVRAGEEVALPPRPVVVSAFDVLARRGADLDVAVECSSGTYVRALARDLGAALGVGGHLTALRRTRVGPFTLAHARTLEALETRRRCRSRWTRPWRWRSRAATPTPAEAADLAHGRPLRPRGWRASRASSPPTATSWRWSATATAAPAPSSCSPPPDKASLRFHDGESRFPRP